MPYSGGVTTLESLWMGVPVLTRPGDRFAGRHSTSHLAQAGITRWIAASDDDYVARAVDAASHPASLAEERRSLRARLAASPACDGARFTRDLEQAFRQMADAR
jgi:protein O-GlcNAc transferase